MQALFTNLLKILQTFIGSIIKTLPGSALCFHPRANVSFYCFLMVALMV